MTSRYRRLERLGGLGGPSLSSVHCPLHKQRVAQRLCPPREEIGNGGDASVIENRLPVGATRAQERVSLLSPQRIRAPLRRKRGEFD